MTEILSQAEIDALVNSMSEQDEAADEVSIDPLATPKEPEPLTANIDELIEQAKKQPGYKEPPKKSKAYRLYDFRRPDKLSKLQIRDISNKLALFSRQVGNTLSEFLRLTTEVMVLDVSQCNYSDMFKAVPMETLFCLYKLGDNTPGHGILLFNTNLAFTLIERLMGGVGSPKQVVRELTDLEKRLSGDLFGRFLVSYDKAMQPYISIDAQITHIENDEKLLPRAFPMEEIFIKSVFEIRLPQIKGFLTISHPYSLLYDYLSTRKGDEDKPKDSGKQITVNDVPENVKEMKLRAKVILGDAVITVRRLLDLKPGSVIQLETGVDEELTAYVDKKPRLKIRPGFINNKMGGIITSINMEDGND